MNCANNPYCLNGLGEKKLVSLLQKECNLAIEKSDYFREKNEYVGLINLGATCYINTYLQVLSCCKQLNFFQNFVLQNFYSQGMVQ